MILNRLKSAIDRNERNKLNENFDIIERGQSSIQTQLNQLVIEGDSSVEAAQARVSADDTVYDTLKARLDAENEEVTQQLAQVAKINIAKANAKYPLDLPTYDGSGQSTHPSVIPIPQSFTASGARYVMAHTPYPNTNDDYENPCILWSYYGEDFFEWGATNPIDKPTAAQTTNGAYMSDCELVFNYTLNRLELYYRYNNNNDEFLYRKTTTDGVTWSARELVLDKVTFGRIMMSPTIYHDGAKYIMWAVETSGRITRYESNTALAGTWSMIGEVTLNYDASVPTGYQTWHLHVLWDSDNSRYIFTFNSLAGDGVRHLLIGESLDGNVVDNIKVVMLPSTDPYAFDRVYLYRASLLKVYGNVRYLYYGAYDGSEWRIGMVHSVDNSIHDYEWVPYRKPDGTNKYGEIDVKRIDLEGDGSLNKESLLFKTSGVKSVKIVNVSPNTLQVQTESGELANLSAAEITMSDTLKFFKSGSTAGQIKNVASSAFHFLNESGTSFLDSHVKDLVAQNRVRLLVEGVNGADFKLSSLTSFSNTIDITGSNNDTLGNLRAGYVVFGEYNTNVGAVPEGAIRYNKTAKKHQGYDGTVWHDLY